MLIPFCPTAHNPISSVSSARPIELAAGEKQILCLQRVIGFVQNADN